VSEDKKALFRFAWNQFTLPGLPTPAEEYVFYEFRRWRFDFAFVAEKIAVEVEGNAWNVKGGGRHMQDSDLDKYNHAALYGWRVFRFSPGMLTKDPAQCVGMVVQAVQFGQIPMDSEMTRRFEALFR
jgi:hypothetical protein